MRIGAMNHPAFDPADEIRWMRSMGLDFIDLTLEPPGAAYWQIDIPGLRSLLQEHEMGIVGHTAWYLPLGHPFEEVRRGTVSGFLRCAEIFAQLGATDMNIHPDKNAPMRERAPLIARNLQSLREIVEGCHDLGVSVMIENIPGDFNTAAQLGELLDPLPELGLHLDLGHTNLEVTEDSAESILAAYGPRVRHVHLHDNFGGSADLHLPLGAGTVDIPRSLKALKKAGYDGNITLEVFAPDRELLRFSAEKLRRLWEEH
jgi:sugar phosphate isomerase/epimerase